jgi:hypothetical protein
MKTKNSHRAPQTTRIVTGLLLLLVAFFQFSAWYRNFALVFSQQDNDLQWLSKVQEFMSIPSSASTTSTAAAAGVSSVVTSSPLSDNGSNTERIARRNSTIPHFKIKVSTQTSFPNTEESVSATENITCPTEPPTDIVISRSTVLAQNTTRLEQLKRFTVKKYEPYLLEKAGKEHYTLLHYLTREYNAKNANCHVVDIGTRYVTSALALGAAGTAPVWTFDLPESNERFAAFRKQSPKQWHYQLEKKENGGVRIKFHNVNLLDVSLDEFRNYMSTWLILLDTAHRPYTIPFEREFFDRLLSINFKGLLILDDIQWSDEMPRWWNELQEMASSLTNNLHCTISPRSDMPLERVLLTFLVNFDLLINTVSICSRVENLKSSKVNDGATDNTNIWN